MTTTAIAPQGNVSSYSGRTARNAAILRRLAESVKERNGGKEFPEYGLTEGVGLTEGAEIVELPFAIPGIDSSGSASWWANLHFLGNGKVSLGNVSGMGLTHEGYQETLADIESFNQAQAT